MTPEQLEKLYKIGKKIQGVCPDMYSSIRFNLKPGRKDVNVNLVVEDDDLKVEESKILKDSNK
jgi:hypothetical protein